MQLTISLAAIAVIAVMIFGTMVDLVARNDCSPDCYNDDCHSCPLCCVHTFSSVPAFLQSFVTLENSNPHESREVIFPCEDLAQFIFHPPRH